MGSRSDWLTDVAKPIAEELAAQSGSLKHTLSAGIMALNCASLAERAAYMAKAVGKESLVPSDEERTAKALITVLGSDSSYGLDHSDLAMLEAVRRILAADTGAPSSKTIARRKSGSRTHPKAG